MRHEAVTEARVERIKQELMEALHRHGLAQQRIRALEAEVEGLHQPCHCDPPGHGSDGHGRGCNGCCQVREILSDQVAASGPEAWESFRAAFDEAVETVRERREVICDHEEGA